MLIYVHLKLGCGPKAPCERGKRRALVGLPRMLQTLLLLKKENKFHVGLRIPYFNWLPSPPTASVVVGRRSAVGSRQFSKEKLSESVIGSSPLLPRIGLRDSGGKEKCPRGQSRSTAASHTQDRIMALQAEAAGRVTPDGCITSASVPSAISTAVSAI